MADWLPTYMHRVDGANINDAGLLVGAVTVIGGLGGTITGGFLAEKFKVTPRTITSNSRRIKLVTRI